MRSVLQRQDDSNRIELGAGAILISEGDRSGRLYVLSSGSVEVLRGETRVAVISEPGAFFGEMSVLLDVPHTATVRALTPVTLYVFDDGVGFLRSDPEIAHAVARVLAQRLNNAATFLVDLTRQYAGRRTHLGMVGDVLASLLNQPDTDLRPEADRQPEKAQ